MPDTIEIILMTLAVIAAGAAIWAALSARTMLREFREQSEIALHVGLTVAEPGSQLRLNVQNIGRVAATVTHVAVQLETPRLQGEHRERLEAPMRLTLAWQLAPARSTEITMAPLPDLAEALLSISISRFDLIGLAWDQDGTLHRSEPMRSRPSSGVSAARSPGWRLPVNRLRTTPSPRKRLSTLPSQWMSQ